MILDYTISDNSVTYMCGKKLMFVELGMSAQQYSISKPLHHLFRGVLVDHDALMARALVQGALILR